MTRRDLFGALLGVPAMAVVPELESHTSGYSVTSTPVPETVTVTVSNVFDPRLEPDWVDERMHKWCKVAHDHAAEAVVRGLL